MGVKAAYAEREEGKRVFRRGFVLKGERVAVVDDVLTTGKSLMETVRAVEEAGGKVVAAGVMVQRGDFRTGIPFKPVLRLDIPTYDPSKCPLCRAGVPLKVPGKGKV